MPKYCNLTNHKHDNFLVFPGSQLASKRNEKRNPTRDTENPLGGAGFDADFEEKEYRELCLQFAAFLGFAGLSDTKESHYVIEGLTLSSSLCIFVKIQKPVLLPEELSALASMSANNL